MSNEAINAIERDIKEARKHVELGDSLERLLNNRDFKKVIVEGYFEKEAARLVHLKADHEAAKSKWHLFCCQTLP